MVRPTRAQINLQALQANFRAIADYLRQEQERSGQPTSVPGIIAVLKANAYGHGSGRVGLALEEAGATMLACADIEEGVALRQAGVRAEILVFGALSVSDLAGIFEANLTPTISSPSAGRALQQAAAARGVRLSYHLKIDTGMNRLGFRHDNLRRTQPALLASPNLELVGIYTHLGTADAPEDPLFGEQRERFMHAIAEVEALGGRARLRHAANSAALLRDSRLWLDLVRPGLLLYGVVPPPLATTLPLVPVMTLTSRITAVKGVRAGERIGYGGRWSPEQPSKVAVVPAGYADGLDARLEGRGFVLLRGRRVPIVGSVCMDMLTVDVTGVAVEPGDEVVFLGAQGDEALQRIDVREMAAAIGTIPYEILCRIGSRIERVYTAE
jgi:alanine racemase